MGWLMGMTSCFTSECLTAPENEVELELAKAWYHANDANVKHGTMFSTFRTKIEEKDSLNNTEVENGAKRKKSDYR